MPASMGQWPRRPQAERLAAAVMLRALIHHRIGPASAAGLMAITAARAPAGRWRAAGLPNGRPSSQHVFAVSQPLNPLFRGRGFGSGPLGRCKYQYLSMTAWPAFIGRAKTSVVLKLDICWIESSSVLCQFVFINDQGP
jgi:hypothetical protein